MSEMKITAIDLAKTNFYLFSINAYGKPSGKIKLSRSRLLNWKAQQPLMTVAMEACGGIALLGPGDTDARSQSDPASCSACKSLSATPYNDAQAIAEACQHIDPTRE